MNTGCPWVAKLACFVVVCLIPLVGGCGLSRSTARRAGLVGLGGSVGGLVAHQLKADAGQTALAAGGAALATQLALGDDKAALQAGFDQGYVQGQSDAIKRQYFLRQAAEKDPLPGKMSPEGAPVYYTIPLQPVVEGEKPKETSRATLKVVE